MFWPGELHLYDENLHLPDKPVINQYLNFGKEQFSKSRGVIVNSKYIVEEYGLDPVRLYLTLIMPENADTEFTWTDFVERHNSVTIGNLGNFINRTLKMAKDLPIKSEFLEEEVIKETEKKIIEAKTFLSSPEYKNYAQSILSLSDFGNKYLSEREPWKVEEEKEKARIISNALFVVLVIQALAKPLLVESVEKLENILNVSFKKWPENAGVIKEKFNEISINKPEPLFSKIDKDIIEKETKKRD
jgi:methionyl-tRNA synthetase